MPRVVHFEIPMDNPERAVGFYSKVFNWKIEKWAGPVEYWLVMTGDTKQPGIDGGMVKRQAPINGITNTIDVPSIDEFVKKVVASGGKLIMSKHAIPGVGYQAYCQDTEGNIFGIHQSDTSAK